MSSLLSIWVLASSAVACLLVSGVLRAFSDFLMQSLRKATPDARSQAMQILNREVFRSIFIVLLLGMSGVSAALGLVAVVAPPDAGALLVILGSLAYVVGVFFVTMLGNVPKNQNLAAMPDGGSDAQAYWPEYHAGWVFWNHVRTVFSGIAGVAYMIAAILVAMSI